MSKQTAWFYKTAAWVKCRDAYLRQAGGLCERCLKKGIYTAGREVHHKIWITPENINDPNITLNPDNLILLCKACHEEMHQGSTRYYIDKMGNLTQRRPPRSGIVR